MKNLFTKNIWAVACLSCLVFIGTSCNESIDVERCISLLLKRLL